MFSILKADQKLTFLLSLLVFGLTFTIYLMTLAPTVTFWDCGELIACSYILGIPHPPGSPLYVLIGRIFTLLPIGDQIAFRTNLASALFSALTAVLGFLIVLILSRRLKISTLFSYVAALSGAFFLAFSNTFWANAIESEVYAISMFLMLLLLYLTLIWMDHNHTTKGDRLLVFIAYLGLLSTAVHMTTYLVMPVIFLIIILHDREKLKDPKIWITGALFSLIMLAPTVPTEVFLLGIAIWLLLSLLYSFQTRFDSRWTLPLAVTLVAIVGYSSQLYIPIRSAHNPAIDENNPDSWEKFKSFLERKQYLQTGMIERSFTRRGKFINQIGDYERIGWFGFFKQQYIRTDFWIVSMFLGLFGLMQLIRHRPREGIGLLILLLITTLGLVWYMNFGDGTVPREKLEVRDRDYFFLPGYVLFALVMGLGAAALLSYVKRQLDRYTPRLATIHSYAVALIILILPVLTLANNYERNNRSGNWVAYDFAYNLLNSCDQNALLFTNGDNDTFPLWFVQEVEKIRPDVRVINFSLLNGGWYIKQCRDKRQVPITLTDQEINSLRLFSDGTRIHRVQDQMLEHILDVNAWRYPVNFALTVASENRIYKGRSLDYHLMMEGLVQRLIPQEGQQMVDLKGTQTKLFQTFKYTGIDRSNLRWDETSRRMIGHYLTCFFTLADTLAKQGDYQQAIKTTLRAKELDSTDWRVYAMLVQLYVKAYQPAKAEEVVAAAPPEVEKEKLYYNLAYTYKLIGKQTEYEQGMQKILQLNPHYKGAYEELFGAYYNQKRRDDLLQLLGFWTQNNPDDRQARSLLAGFSNPAFNFPDTTTLRQALKQ